MEENEIAWPETILYYGLYFGLGLAISAIIDIFMGGIGDDEWYLWFLAPAGIWTMMLVDKEVLYKSDDDKGFWDIYNEEDTTDRKNSDFLRKYVVRPTMGILLILIILDRTGIYSF